MQDLDTTFNDVRALRLVCKSLDVVCLRRSLTAVSLFRYCPAASFSSIIRLEELRHFNGVLSSDLSSARTLTIPNWGLIYGKNFATFQDLSDTGAVEVILINTLVILLICYSYILLICCLSEASPNRHFERLYPLEGEIPFGVCRKNRNFQHPLCSVSAMSFSLRQGRRSTTQMGHFNTQSSFDNLSDCQVASEVPSAHRACSRH